MLDKNLKYLLRYAKNKCQFKLKWLKRKVKFSSQKIKKYPSTIQLPITYLCNFDCVMCGMRHMVGRKDFSAKEIGTILSNPLFKEVKYVGVNGGEPFLKKDIVECFEEMMKCCPKLQAFNIISNGYFTDKILSTLELIKPECEKRKIKVNLSISVDGYMDMQDFHRGKEKAFENADCTIKQILEDKNKYVDDIMVICTITKYNIERINEVEVWAADRGVEVSYNIATENVRIENEERVQDFSLFSDEHARMLATEFFYQKYLETRNEKYFGLFLYLKDKKRYAPCPCQYNDWVTLTPDAQIGYCATHSKNLGSALEESAYDIFQRNIDYLQEIKKTHCENCSHYLYQLNADGIKILEEDQMKNWFVR